MFGYLWPSKVASVPRIAEPPSNARKLIVESGTIGKFCNGAISVSDELTKPSREKPRVPVTERTPA